MNRRALIIDDDPDARAIAATVLRDVMPGVRVTEATDAISLATAVARISLDVALVSRDLHWVEGLEVIKLLHQRQPGCATILMGTLPADQTDPDAQPDAHLSRSIAGLARLGQVALRAVEKRSRARHTGTEGGALNRVPVAIVELTTDERVLSANDSAVALFGHGDAASLVGRMLGELLSVSGEPAGAREGRSIAVAAAASADGISVLVRPGSGAAVEHRLRVRAEMRDGVITGYSAALLPEPIASGGRMDSLVYAVSHDLQQPLATTGRSAQMLADRLQTQGRLDGQEERMLRRIVSGTERMETLMKGLLDYVRTGQNALVRTRVDLDSVCGEVVRGLHAQLEETGGVVRWKDLPVIHASRAEMTRLMENLIGNAIKFHTSDKPVVEVDCADREDTWLLSVRDNGIGIDQGDAERIFQPFQRLHTESEYPGTGIGLAVCQQICERHGGHIWVTPNPQGGSTFFATISKDE